MIKKKIAISCLCFIFLFSAMFAVISSIRPERTMAAETSLITGDNSTFENGGIPTNSWNWNVWYFQDNNAGAEFSISEEKAVDGKALKISNVYADQVSVWGFGMQYIMQTIEDGEYEFTYSVAGAGAYADSVSLSVLAYVGETESEIKADSVGGYKSVISDFTQITVPITVKTEGDDTVFSFNGDEVLRANAMKQVRFQLYFGGGDPSRTFYLDNVTLTAKSQEPPVQDKPSLISGDNSSFENGGIPTNTWNWNVWYFQDNNAGAEFTLSEEKSIDGKALKISNVYADRVSIWGFGMQYIMQTIEDGSYDFSYQIASAEAYSECVGLTIHAYVGAAESEMSSTTLVGFYSTNTEFSLITIPFDVKTEGTEKVFYSNGVEVLRANDMKQVRFQLYFGGGDPARTYYLDNIKITEREVAPPDEEFVEGNLIANNGFENDFTVGDFAWDQWFGQALNGATAEQSNVCKNGGSYAMKISHSEKVNAQLLYAKQAEAAYGKYTLKYYFAVSDTTAFEAMQASIEIFSNDTDSQKLAIRTVEAPITTENYTFVEMTAEFELHGIITDLQSGAYKVVLSSGQEEVVIENAQFSQYRISIYMRGATDFYIDTVSLVQTERYTMEYDEGQEPSEELVVNGGFEEDSPAIAEQNAYTAGAWTPNFLDADMKMEFLAGTEENPAHSGSRMLAVTGRGESWHRPVYTISAAQIQFGIKYFISSYVKTDRKTNIMLMTQVGDKEAWVNSFIITPGTWTNLTGWFQFKLGSDGKITMVTGKVSQNLNATSLSDVYIAITTSAAPQGTEGLADNYLLSDIYIDDVSVLNENAIPAPQPPEEWEERIVDFTNSETNSFTPYCGVWTTSEGVFEQTESAETADMWNRAAYYRYAFNDFFVEYEIQLTGGHKDGWSGIVFGKEKPEDAVSYSSCYQLTVRQDGAIHFYRWIPRADGSGISDYNLLLSENCPASVMDDFVKFTVYVQNGILKFYVNDQIVAEMVLEGYEGGYFSLNTGATAAKFRNVRVCGLATADAEDLKPAVEYKPNSRDESSQVFTESAEQQTLVTFVKSLEIGAVIFAAVGGVALLAWVLFFIIKKKKGDRS